MLQSHVISKQAISFATFALFTCYQTKKNHWSKASLTEWGQGRSSKFSNSKYRIQKHHRFVNKHMCFSLCTN